MSNSPLSGLLKNLDDSDIKLRDKWEDNVDSLKIDQVN